MKDIYTFRTKSVTLQNITNWRTASYSQIQISHKLQIKMDNLQINKKLTKYHARIERYSLEIKVALLDK